MDSIFLPERNISMLILHVEMKKPHFSKFNIPETEIQGEHKTDPMEFNRILKEYLRRENVIQDVLIYSPGEGNQDCPLWREVCGPEKWGFNRKEAGNNWINKPFDSNQRVRDPGIGPSINRFVSHLLPFNPYGCDNHLRE